MFLISILKFNYNPLHVTYKLWVWVISSKLNWIDFCIFFFFLILFLALIWIFYYKMIQYLYWWWLEIISSVEFKLDLPVLQRVYISFYHLRINCTVQLHDTMWTSLNSLKYARDNKRELDIALCINFMTIINA